MRGSHPLSNSGFFDTSEDGRGQTTFKLYGYRIEPLLAKLTTCEELMARLHEWVNTILAFAEDNAKMVRRRGAKIKR